MLTGKLILVYGALVGLPLLALTSVLRYGQNLSAPPAVSGSWKVESEAVVLAAGCYGMLVKQSGTDVTITFEDARHTTVSGEIANRKLMAASPGPQLELAVVGVGSEQRLVGSYRDKSFTAVRARLSCLEGPSHS